MRMLLVLLSLVIAVPAQADFFKDLKHGFENAGKNIEESFESWGEKIVDGSSDLNGELTEFLEDNNPYTLTKKNYNKAIDHLNGVQKRCYTFDGEGNCIGNDQGPAFDFEPWSKADVQSKNIWDSFVDWQGEINKSIKDDFVGWGKDMKKNVIDPVGDAFSDQKMKDFEYDMKHDVSDAFKVGIKAGADIQSDFLDSVGNFFEDGANDIADGFRKATIGMHKAGKDIGHWFEPQPFIMKYEPDVQSGFFKDLGHAMDKGFDYIGDGIVDSGKGFVNGVVDVSTGIADGAIEIQKGIGEAAGGFSDWISGKDTPVDANGVPVNSSWYGDAGKWFVDWGKDIKDDVVWVGKEIRDGLYDEGWHFTDKRDPVVTITPVDVNSSLFGNLENATHDFNKAISGIKTAAHEIDKGWKDWEHTLKDGWNEGNQKKGIETGAILQSSFFGNVGHFFKDIGRAYEDAGTVFVDSVKEVNDGFNVVGEGMDEGWAKMWGHDAK